MIVSAFLITLFWLSLPAVGFAGLLFLEERGLRTNLVGKDSLIDVFIAACLGFFTLVPLLVLGYILPVPTALLAVLWAGIFIYAVYRLYKEPRYILRLLHDLKTHKSLWLLAAVMLVDYAVSLYLGGYMSGDAWVHIARIHDSMQNGLNLADPYFPALIDARYNLSLIHGIYAIGAVVTDQTAIAVWLFSLAFFRSLMALGVYVVMKLISDSRVLAATSAATAVVYLSFDWRFVLYPNRLAMLWLLLVAIGLLKLFENRKDRLAALVLLAGTVLSAMTHPVFSLGVACFAGLALLIYIVQQKRQGILAAGKRQGWLLVTPFILALPALAGAFLLPSRGARGSADGGYTVHLFGQLEVMDPSRIYSPVYVVSLLLILLFIFRKKRSSGFRSVLLASILTYPIIALTPVFELVNEFLSARIVSRYRSGTNFLGYTLALSTVILTGIYWLVVRVKKWLPRQEAVMVIASLVLIMIYSGNAREYFATQRGLRNNARETVARLEAVLPENHSFSKENIVVSSEQLSLYIPALANVAVVKIKDSHAPPSADPAARALCLEELTSLDDGTRRGALLSLRPKYYILDDTMKDLSSKPELVSIKNPQEQVQTGFFTIDYAQVGGNYQPSAACGLIAAGDA